MPFRYAAGRNMENLGGLFDAPMSIPLFITEAFPSYPITIVRFSVHQFVSHHVSTQTTDRLFVCFILHTIAGTTTVCLFVPQPDANCEDYLAATRQESES